LFAPATRQSNDHPLAPVLRWARGQITRMDEIQDYSATLIKQERIGGKLREKEQLFVKVRHRPVSIYVRFLSPAKFEGRECLYIQGRNDGKLLVHVTGLQRLVGTLALNPIGKLAMSDNRYPIMELGIRRLAERLLEVGAHDARFGECEVRMLPTVKIGGRDCDGLEVVHPYPRPEFIFHIARIYVDAELNLPVRYVNYEWPEEAAGEPRLAEEYTYLNLKLNNGFTDYDFDPSNPDYRFPGH
jgi:hypothetical protein